MRRVIRSNPTAVPALVPALAAVLMLTAASIAAARTNHAQAWSAIPLPPAQASPATSAAPKGSFNQARTVNSIADTTDGVCDAVHCTLREAIAASGSNDLVNFSPLFNSPQTIRLTGALPNINVQLWIAGPGADRLTVRRESGGDYRIFTANAPLTLSGMTLSNGRADFGGAVLAEGALVMQRCVLSGNTAELTGGGLLVNGNAIIENTTVTGNTAGFVAAMAFYGGSATLRNVTVSGNRALTAHAGIGLVNPSTTVLNSTFYGNVGAGSGAVLVTGQVGAASATLKNNVFMANAVPSLQITDFQTESLDSGGHNLSDDGGGGFLTATGDQVDTDARLLPLAGNGGVLPTHLPRFDSPLIDAGDDSGAPTSDARNVARPQGGDVDIGAVELTPILVTSAADPGDGTCDASCTLRDALLAAEGNGIDADDILFQKPQFDSVQTINLTSALPDIVGAINLVGPGANRLTVRRDTGGDYRVMYISTGAIASIAGMTLSNGRALFGGGIDNRGSLWLVEAALTGNAATASGGGLHNGGTAVVARSTLSNNIAGVDGGGIFNVADNGTTAALYLLNSTVYANSSVFYTGGVQNAGFVQPGPTLVSINSTIVGNQGGNPDEGGLTNFSNGDGGWMEVANTVIAGNSPVDISNVSATFLSRGHNLASDNGAGVLTGPADQTGKDARLLPFGNYGGPTNTLLPAIDSPLVDAADTALAPARDQRGIERPLGSAADIGAVERLELFGDGFE